MNNMPTAEEFLQNNFGFTDDEMKRFSAALSKAGWADIDNITGAMIEYTKLHLRVALETVNRELYIRSDFDWTIDFDVYPENNIR